MTDQSTPTINNRIILSLKDYNGYDFCGEKSCKGQHKADELVSSMLEIIADFAERITPEAPDIDPGFMLDGFNAAIDTIAQNVKAELAAAPKELK